MKAELGRPVIAGYLAAGGVIGLTQVGLAMSASAELQVLPYLLFGLPFVLCLLAGVGLWRDTHWGFRLAVAMLLAQTVFVWCQAFTYVFYGGVALPVLVAFERSFWSVHVDLWTVEIAPWLGANLALVLESGHSPFAAAVNLLPLFALAYLFRLRPRASETISPAERVTHEHEGDIPSRPAHLRLATYMRRSRRGVRPAHAGGISPSPGTRAERASERLGTVTPWRESS